MAQDSKVCVPVDLCAGNTCAAQHQNCNSDSGKCDTCVSGYVPNGSGGCVADPCASGNPCVHRKCTVSNTGTATCGQCDSGFIESTPTMCIADPCPGPCMNRACTSTGGTATCGACKGNFVEKDPTTCVPNPCGNKNECATQHRSCTNNAGTAMCGNCDQGYVDMGGTCMMPTMTGGAGMGTGPVDAGTVPH
jgi:hypothetical protein